MKTPAIALTLLWYALATAGPLVAQEPGPEAVEAKRLEFLEVVAELRSRPRPDLDESRRARRAERLDELERYADRRRFALNTFSSVRPISSFVDVRGTRCALAHLLETGGGEEVLDWLAGSANHCWISQLTSLPSILSWSHRHGLTLEEIAYIQAPGIFVPRTPEEPPNFEIDPAEERAMDLAGSPLARGGSVSGLAGASSGGRRKAPSATLSWEGWWSRAQDGLLGVRDRRDRRRPGRTGNEIAPTTSRPAPAVVANLLLPILRRVADREPELRAQALVSLARASSGEDARDAVARVVDALPEVESQERDFLLLALAMSGDAAAAAPLREIAGDTRGGRALFEKTGSIPDRHRALAALALGFSGDEEAATLLLDLLEEKRRTGAEPGPSAALGLGLLAGRGVATTTILPRLRKLLDDEGSPILLRAQAPAALALTGDRSALAPLVEILARFRGPVELRRSAALAVPRLARGFEPGLAEALMKAALRDPDAATRQLAIAAIGELAHSAPAAADDETLERLTAFLVDGVGGRLSQKADRGWYALAAGLFAARHTERSQDLLEDLERLALRGADRDDRAAATVALGLVPGLERRERLRSILDKARDRKIRGYAAEALGLQGDTGSEAALLELIREGGADELVHRAALGLGHLGTPSLVAPMVEALGETPSRTAQAALAMALARIGDGASMGPLSSLALDRKAETATRERALGVLGAVAEPRDLPWNDALKRVANPGAMPGSLRLAASTF